MATYPDARSLFEAARDAAVELRRMDAREEAMRAREGLRAAGWSPSGRSPGVRDANAATDARMDAEDAAAPFRRGYEATLAAARSVLYGPDGSGGVAALMGLSTARMLDDYYLGLETWDSISRALGQSVSWCRSQRDRAMDEADAYGCANVLEGRGTAEG